jgi:hypothetical protein
MKVYDITDSEGHVMAFEVSNAFLSRSTACRVACGIPGAKLIRKPRIFPSQDDFCEFEIEGVAFVVWEPWGDNSRYWVGPKSERWVPQITQVRDEFARWSRSDASYIGLLACEASSKVPRPINRDQTKSPKGCSAGCLQAAASATAIAEVGALARLRALAVKNARNILLP